VAGREFVRARRLGALDLASVAHVSVARVDRLTSTPNDDTTP